MKESNPHQPKTLTIKPPGQFSTQPNSINRDIACLQLPQSTRNDRSYSSERSYQRLASNRLRYDRIKNILKETQQRLSHKNRSNSHKRKKTATFGPNIKWWFTRITKTQTVQSSMSNTPKKYSSTTRFAQRSRSVPNLVRETSVKVFKPLNERLITPILDPRKHKY